MISNYVSVASGRSPLAGFRLSGRAAAGAAAMIACFVARRVLWEPEVERSGEEAVAAAQEVRKLADALIFQVGEPKELVSALYNIKRAARIFVTTDKTGVYQRDRLYFESQRAALVATCGRELLALSVASGVPLPDELISVLARACVADTPRAT